MKIQANTIRPGYVIEHNGKQMSVIKIQLIQPGKGGAFIQV
ncbi:MAG: elongation factor P, partial [Alphaproteobacteria bacterium]|nr:elongation factor P [Alphaproteobacteria bacterium]